MSHPLCFHVRRMAALILLATGLTACGGGGSSSSPTPPSPPAAVTGDFQAFVEARFDETSDRADPVATNDLMFEDLALDAPAAFDDLLARFSAVLLPKPTR